jgi:hypothetical protein
MKIMDINWKNIAKAWSVNILVVAICVTIATLLHVPLLAACSASFVVGLISGAVTINIWNPIY